MFGLHRVPSKWGWKVSSRRGWFFLGLGSEIYTFHLAIGRFGMTWDAKNQGKPRKNGLDKNSQGA